MPTIFTHAVVPLTVALGLGKKVISRRLLWTGAACSMLPDADVVGLALGAPWNSAFGHRGFTHSIVFALGVGLIGALCRNSLNTSGLRAFWFLFIATASHGILDAFTTGGPGVAFLWPWSEGRYFAAHIIEVSPIGIARFLSARGAEVLWSELVWVWAPCTLVLTALAITRRHHQTP